MEICCEALRTDTGSAEAARVRLTAAAAATRELESASTYSRPEYGDVAAHCGGKAEAAAVARLYCTS